MSLLELQRVSVASDHQRLAGSSDFASAGRAPAAGAAGVLAATTGLAGADAAFAFAADELAIEVKDRALHVTARKAEDEAERKFLHRGIATRAFERRFHLADHVQVTGALHENGMLHIDLIREVPEALKPRRIAIAAGERTQANLVDAKSVN